MTDFILKNPPVLLGLIALIGLILQRKKISDVVKGTLTAAFGMVILGAGVNMIITPIAQINATIQSKMGVQVAEGLSDASFTAQYGGSVGLAMFLGLVLHLLIARFTPFKTIFLTGHMLWWFPFVIVAGGVESGLKGTTLIVVSGILSALYWSIMPWVMRRYVWDATGDESFLIGHPTGILSLLAGFIAKRVGNKAHSTEDIQVPQGLAFFKEISITGAIVMSLMSLVLGFFMPNLYKETGNLLMYAINNGINFGAGLLVMLYGVRLLINQIIPAFQGIAEKLVPGAKPAFDVPILFNYKPNAVIIGFLVAMVTSTIVIVMANTSHFFSVLLVPMVITSFFECGGAAVIAEGQGGMRGTIIGTMAASLLMVLLVGFSAQLAGHTIQNWLLIFGGNDLSLMQVVAKLITGVFGGI